MWGALAAITVALGASWLPRRACAENGYSGDSCCLPIHETEIQGAYMHLVDTARTCPRRVNEEHPELRSYFCMFCNPKHLQYMSCCKNPVVEKAASSGGGGAVFRCNDTTPTMYKAGSSCDEQAVNTLRLCKSFANRLFPGKVYDECGMSVWNGDSFEQQSTANPAAYNPNGIVPWGDVDGASGDDPVMPSLFWKEGVEGFVRDIKPPLLDEFFVEIVDGEEGCFKGAAAALSPGGAALAVLLALVAAAAGQLGV